MLCDAHWYAFTSPRFVLFFFYLSYSCAALQRGARPVHTSFIVDLDPCHAIAAAPHTHSPRELRKAKQNHLSSVCTRGVHVTSTSNGHSTSVCECWISLKRTVKAVHQQFQMGNDGIYYDAKWAYVVDGVSACGFWTAFVRRHMSGHLKLVTNCHRMCNISLSSLDIDGVCCVMHICIWRVWMEFGVCYCCVIRIQLRYAGISDKWMFRITARSVSIRRS